MEVAKDFNVHINEGKRKCVVSTLAPKNYRRNSSWSKESNKDRGIQF